MGVSSTLKNLLNKVTHKPKKDMRKLIGLNDRVFLKKKHSCPVCHIHIEDKELAQNLYVCPGCQYHFRIDAKERLRFIVDGGILHEFAGAIETVNPLEFPGYEQKIQSAREKSGLDEGVLCGLGKLHEKDVVFGFMSFQFMGGSMGSVVGERIARALLIGAERSLPVIIFTGSGGARMQEGIFSLMQMTKTSHAVALLEKAKQPLIIVLTDPTTGGVTASFAMLGDIILSEPGALIGFAGPRVIEGTIKQKLPDGFQRAKFLLEKGFIDAIVNRHDLRNTLSLLIDMHQFSGGRRTL